MCRLHHNKAPGVVCRDSNGRTNLVSFGKRPTGEAQASRLTAGIGHLMLQGIFPVLPTLFSPDDSLDLAAQRQVIRFALDAHADGLVFPGVASEYDFLAPNERGELLALLADETNGQVPLIGGASAATSAEAIAAGRQATQLGIGYLMIMAPACLALDLEAHRRFFGEITSELSNVQIILQNAPRPIGAGLDAAAIAELASSNRSIAYIKEETLPSGPAISSLLAADIPHLKGVFGGGGARYIIDELTRGALGAMPAVELTDLHAALYQAHASGATGRARELYRLSLPLLASQAIYRMRLTKYVLNRRGVANSGRVRAPLPELDDHAQCDVDQMLTDLRGAFP